MTTITDASIFQGTNRLAPFNPTCTEAQQTALKLLELSENDVLFDLGCGDGRLLILAASQHAGLKCVGIELDPVYVKRAQDAVASITTLDVSCRVDIRQGDVMELLKNETRRDGEDVSSNILFLRDATAIFVYLLPKGLQSIKPILKAAARKRLESNQSFRVISYMFRIPGWEPVLVDRSTKGDCRLYLYNLNSIQ